jgi:glycine cleavage system H protein
LTVDFTERGWEIRLCQELVTAAERTLEKGRYDSLSCFVSEAIRLRLEELKQSHEKIVEKSPEYPAIRERFLYTSNHLWAMVTPEGNVRIGFSDYAQERLKGVASIQTHPIGYEVKKGASLGVVETWMFMFDLFSPVSGRITKINKLLKDEHFIINEAPHELLWVAEIKPDNLITLEEELRDLMSFSRYKMWMSRTGRSRILSI